MHGVSVFVDAASQREGEQKLDHGSGDGHDEVEARAIPTKSGVDHEHHHPVARSKHTKIASTTETATPARSAASSRPHGARAAQIGIRQPRSRTSPAPAAIVADESLPTAAPSAWPWTRSRSSSVHLSIPTTCSNAGLRPAPRPKKLSFAEPEQPLVTAAVPRKPKIFTIAPAESPENHQPFSDFPTTTSGGSSATTAVSSTSVPHRAPSSTHRRPESPVPSLKSLKSILKNRGEVAPPSGTPTSDGARTPREVASAPSSNGHGGGLTASGTTAMREASTSVHGRQGRDPSPQPRRGAKRAATAPAETSTNGSSTGLRRFMSNPRRSSSTSLVASTSSDRISNLSERTVGGSGGGSGAPSDARSIISVDRRSVFSLDRRSVFSTRSGNSIMNIERPHPIRKASSIVSAAKRAASSSFRRPSTDSAAPNPYLDEDDLQESDGSFVPNQAEVERFWAKVRERDEYYDIESTASNVSPLSSECSLHRNHRLKPETWLPAEPDYSTEEDRLRQTLENMFDARMIAPPSFLLSSKSDGLDHGIPRQPRKALRIVRQSRGSTPSPEITPRAIHSHLPDVADADVQQEAADMDSSFSDEEGSTYFDALEDPDYETSTNSPQSSTVLLTPTTSNESQQRQFHIPAQPRAHKSNAGSWGQDTPLLFF